MGDHQRYHDVEAVQKGRGGRGGEGRGGGEGRDGGEGLGRGGNGIASMDSEEANRPGAGGGRGRDARRTSSRALACYFSIGIAAVSCAALLVLVTCRKSPASEANVLLDEGLLPKATQGGRGHSSLAAVEARLDRLGERFSGLEGRFGKIKQQERDIKGEQEALSAKETGLRGAMRQTAKEMSALRGRVDSIRARREEKDIFAPPSVKHGPSQALVLARKTPAKVSPRPKILDGMPRYAEARGRTAGKAEKVPGYVAKYAKEYEEEARAQQKRYRDHVRVWMKQQRNYVKKEEDYRKGIAKVMAAQAGLAEAGAGQGERGGR